jgi:drug/metabolite transporter (DMT)-like permease
MPYIKDLIVRFIKWEIATSAVNIVFGIVLGVVGIFIANRIWKNRSNYRYFGDMDEGVTWAFIGGIVCAIAGAIIVACNIHAMVEAIFLPETTIYDYVTNLINTK